MGKGGLEVFKFALYVSIPVVMTALVAGNADVLETIIKNRSYVVYPPEAPRPPSLEEFKEMAKAKQSKS